MNMMDFRLLYPLEGVRNIVLQMSFSFDASVQVIYPYMSMGCTIVCVDKGLIGDSEALVNWLIQCQAHLACFTPSFLDICRKSDRFNQENLPGFKQIYFGGEILLKKTVQYLHETFPKALVYNLYGPTESTVDISGCLVTDEMLADEENPIPIGYKMDGTEVWIEAEDGRHCADGEVGELVTVSKSVSRGYFNNPEKTKACFFMGDHGLMGYRTGDLVYRKNELLYFVGRKDFQIKLNGYRIEVEDVTSNLSKVSVVQSCAVLPALGKDGKVAYLAGFVTLISGIEKKSTLEQVVAIKSELKELIPAYMIPQKIFIVPEFKLNTNNKIDRKALAEAYHITLA